MADWFKILLDGALAVFWALVVLVVVLLIAVIAMGVHIWGH